MPDTSARKGSWRALGSGNWPRVGSGLWPTRAGPSIAWIWWCRTCLDAAGKELLAAIHARGAELVATDCLMKATVAEIIDASAFRIDWHR